MMYRKFMKVLEKWREDENHKAMLVNGARQVGKTTVIREFGRKYYGRNFVEINFLKHPEAKKFFCLDRSAETFIKEITSYTGRSLPPHRTLIFFDEVQECPDERTAIKFLAEDGRYDYIEAGTCSGVMYDKVDSYPAGYEHEETLYPMDFEEFLLAWGVPQVCIDSLRDSYDNLTPVDDFTHHGMLEDFAQYMCVGGMPAVVKTFLDTNGDMAAVKRKQRKILDIMREDVRRYADPEDVEGILKAMYAIPADLNAPCKLRERPYFTMPYAWLEDSGYAIPCFAMKRDRDRLSCSQRWDTFKLYMADAGLLVALYPDKLLQFNIMNGDLGANEGGILENLMALNLKGNGFDSFRGLECCSMKDLSEVSFILQQPDGLVPVMVIPGENYTEHKALSRIMNTKAYGLKQAIVFCSGNISRDRRDERIIYLPFYMVMFLKAKSIMEFIHPDDVAWNLGKYLEERRWVDKPSKEQNYLGQ
ncbi:MAG: AAA family ATPase [Clostridia bacterium]|nr:AAA family ATPase [Clostridia bacterium]